MSLTWIPVLYALAMGVDAIAALVFGRWFDRVGLRILLLATVLSAGFAPLAFGTRLESVVLGTILWGIGMGAQESIMRAAIANMTAASRRGTAYGLFNVAYGVAWFAGSAFMGWMYGRSIGAVIAFSVIAQLLAIPCFLVARRLSAHAPMM